MPYRRAVLAISGCTLAIAALNAAEPLVLKFIFDGLERQVQGGALLEGVLMLAGLAVVRELVGAFSNWLTWHTRMGLHYSLLEATVGRITELGPHAELMALDGYYASLVKRQTHGLIANDTIQGKLDGRG